MYGGRSSVGRAPDCGSGCRGFESHLPPHLKSGTANSHADLPFCNNGPSPSGKARDFDSRIPLVRIQLAQPAKRPQRINILWRSFGIGGSYARCAAFLFFHPPRRPGFSKARLGARRLLVSTTGKKFSCRRLYIPANNCYTETSSYTIPRTVMVAMIRS